MSEDAAQGTETAATGNEGNAALNPVFRTAPPPDATRWKQVAESGGAPAELNRMLESQMTAGRQQATQDRAGVQGDDGRSPEELLADATADGDEDPLAKAQAEINKWKTQARENEKRAKANAAKATQYDQYEESQKTEQQKFADRAAAAEARAAEADARYHRTLAAATYDLPVSMIDHLGSGTEDEILARAETFAQAINERAAVIAAAQQQAAQQEQPRNGAGAGFRPVESLRPGALPASDNKPADPNSWFRGMLANSKQR